MSSGGLSGRGLDGRAILGLSTLALLVGAALSEGAQVDPFGEWGRGSGTGLAHIRCPGGGASAALLGWRAGASLARAERPAGATRSDSCVPVVQLGDQLDGAPSAGVKGNGEVESKSKDQPATVQPKGEKVVVTGFGTAGQATADKVSSAVSDYNRQHGTHLGLAFSAEPRMLTLQNSSKLSTSDNNGMLAGLDCSGWYPFNAGWYPFNAGRTSDGDFQLGLSSSPRTGAQPEGRVIVSGFGTAGQDTADKLVLAISDHNAKTSSDLKLTYQEKEERFTLQNSRNLSGDVVDELLASVDASDWYPICAGQDPRGDAQLILSSTNPRRRPEVGKRLLEGAEVMQSPEMTPPMTKPEWVPQGGAVSAARGTRDFLATLGLGPCIGLTLFNETTGVGLLAHFDTEDRVAGLETELRQLGATNGFKAHVIGGDERDYSDKTFEAVLDLLKKYNVGVVETNIGNHASRPSAIALDLRTGAVTDASQQVWLCPESVTAESQLSLTSNRLNFRTVA